jgi:hypothetical protein
VCSIERATGEAGLIFRIGDGKPVADVPSPQRVEEAQADLQAWAAEHEIEIGPDTNLPWWDGAAPDYDWIMSALFSEPSRRFDPPRTPAAAPARPHQVAALD